MKIIRLGVVLTWRKRLPTVANVHLARECFSLASHSSEPQEIPSKYRKRSSAVPVPLKLLCIVTPEGEKKCSSVTVSSEGGRKCQEGQSKAFKQSGLRLKIDKTKWSVMKTHRVKEEWRRKVRAEESGILFSESGIITPWNATASSSSKNLPMLIIYIVIKLRHFI